MSIWITANAGSGKTTYLTRRVVTLLLHGVEPERICCITYTKAAASEMRHRVLGLLRQLLLANDAACRGMVAELLGRPAADEDMLRARGLFGRVLDSSHGGVQLTTIHGFCQDILRRFPLEAGVAPHFTLLEDAAAEKLLMHARHRLLSHYSSGNALLDAAFELIGLRSSESRFDRFLGQIIGNRGMWESVWRGQSPQALRARLFAFHGLEEDMTDAGLREAFCGCVSEEQATVMRGYLPQLVSHKNKTEQEIARVMAAWLEVDSASRLPLIEEFCGLFLKSDGTIGKLVSKELQETPLHQTMAEIAPVVERFVQRCSALACAEESFAVALLAKALLDEYSVAKQALHALDYDDLIVKTCELFANPSMLGWVMSKLDHRIDHLLIDEAQDTSNRQWQLAEALVEELIASNAGVGSGNIPRSLLVVGDEKQSIYSFQGAAPQLFFENKRQFHAMLDGSEAPLRETALTDSYRSAEAVLRLVDAVASQPEIATALTAQGVPQPHRLKRELAAGCVKLYPPLLAPETVAQPALTLPMGYVLEQQAPQLLAEQVAETVAGWLKSGRTLESEGRPVAAGDILILVHKRKPMVVPLIRALQRRGVPVAGIDRLTLSSHLAVQDLLAAMRFVLNPADDLALAHVLRSPTIGISDEQLRALCVGREGTLWERLEGTKWHAPLQGMREQKALSPYVFLTQILEVDGARVAFARQFGEEVHEVLDELKAQAAAMPQEMPSSLAYFHDWMSASSREIKREQESGAGKVRIMTVHGAKGLEAPVVLMVDTVNVPTTQHELAYLAQDGQGQAFPLLSISEEAKQASRLVLAKERKAGALLAEYYRLLYVALTRARDELHVWGIASKTGKVNPKAWYAVVEAAMRRLESAEVDGGLALRDVRPPVPMKTAPAMGPQKAALPVWATRKPPVSGKQAALSPSQLAGEATVSPYVVSAGGDARARGVRIHRVLELLTTESRAEEVVQLLQLVAADWDEKKRHSIAEEVMALHAAERWIWDYPSHAEATVCGTIEVNGQQVAVNGQIDRLVETADAVVILDYKTGRHVPQSADEISEGYRLQMKTYKALVQQLYPEKTVKTAIVWTARPLLMWCDEVVEATAWPNQFVIHQPPLVA